jgi:hypothetical protein
VALSITTHIGLTDEIAPYPRDRRYAVPRHFRSTARDEEVGVEVEVETDVDDLGHPHCRRLEIRPLRDGEVTGETLRRIPIARWLGLLMTAAIWKPSGRPGELQTGIPQPELAEFYRRHGQAGRRPRSGSPLSTDHLKEVADRYRAALDRGEPPTQAVANEMHAARSTAARWVAKARERGLLGPSLPGRAGERDDKP